MGAYPARVTVTTSATRLDNATNSMARGSVIIRNRGAVAVYVGDAGVTTATGFQVDAGETLSVETAGSADLLYGITASGSAACHVLQVGS